jgi:hypothetical protein
MADEQAGTLAFLQNFYTDVTLYMPFEAHERAPVPDVAAPPAPASVAPAPVAPQVVAAPVPAPVVAAPVAPTAVVPPLPPLVAAPPIPAPVAAAVGKLPSLTGAGLGALPPTPPSSTPTPPAPSPAPAPVAPYLLTTFATLGNNPQGVVLLVRLPAEQFKKLPRNVFLNNLLKAIGLVMADVLLVNVEGPYPVALQNLRKEIAATHIMAFGKNLLDVAVRTTQIYEPVQFPAVGLAYLAGAEIEMIEYDTSLKKRLWGGLQRMFLS